MLEDSPSPELDIFYTGRENGKKVAEARTSGELIQFISGLENIPDGDIEFYKQHQIAIILGLVAGNLEFNIEMVANHWGIQDKLRELLS